MPKVNLAKLKDLKSYAECAWACYCTALRNGMFGEYSKGDKENLSNKEYSKLPTYFQVLSVESSWWKIWKVDYKVGFTFRQASEFAKRYMVIYHHVDNWKNISGFGATLFFDTLKQRYILAFKGTNNFKDIIQDIGLIIGVNIQNNALLNFMETIKPFVENQPKPIIFTGHSLGGYLAQWALIYCDNLYKGRFTYSPSEVYTFNSPSIHSWFAPNIFINLNTLKLFKEFSGYLSVDISNKLTHIYDNGGIKIIASAQYGSSNKMPLYTGENSHSIIYIVLILQEAILYFSRDENSNKTIEDFSAYIKTHEAHTPTIYEYYQTKEQEKDMQPSWWDRFKFDFGRMLTLPIPNLISYFPPLPTPTNDLQKAIFYLDSNPIPQKPKDIKFAFSDTFTTDIGIEKQVLANAIKQAQEQQDTYKKELETYNTYRRIYNENIKDYNKDLESYFRIYTTQSNLSYQYYQYTNALLARQISLQISLDSKEYSVYDILNILESKKYYYTYVDSKNIESLNLNDLQDKSKLAYFYCLYHCNNLIVLDSNNKAILDKNIATKSFGYKNDFVNIFIFNKDSITNEYLESRKALYKSFMLLKQERIEVIEKEIERINNLSFKEYEKELKDSKQYVIFNENKSKDSNNIESNLVDKDSIKSKHTQNNLILESKDKSIKIIFLDSIESNISMSNLIHIYNNKIDIFTKDKSIIDIESLVKKYNLDSNILKSNNTRIFFYSQLLQGGIESNNDLLFGNVDSNNKLTESKPIYYLQDSNDSLESNSQDSIDSKDSTQTLQVFLDSKVLTILHYSILESSLNIKLESKSKEAKKILQKQIDCHEAKASCNDKLDSIESTAMLCPILEDNEIKCIHGGIVKLKSNKGKNFKSNNKSMILESDLLNSQIIGCQNTILGVPSPCNLVSVILPTARALKKYNDDYPIMQDLVNGNVFSDKGFPLIITPKPNTFKINSPKPTLDSKQNKECIESKINYHKPIFTICYKIDSLQKNSLNIYQCKINDNELKSNIILNSYELNLINCKELNINDLPNNIQENYNNKYFIYKSFIIQFDNHTREYIYIIPKHIPKILKQAYENNKEAQDNKDYGYGTFKLIDDTHKEYKQESILSKEIWLLPSCCNKLMIEFGNENKENTKYNHNGYNALSNIYVR
ncbi:lipase family protein [Helicobacter saguini]|uniref:lipase family protein n=1 Tax=Helicobacter saguini TaxID=1548018 RepID=UPI001F3EAD85|nr:hypothetical protein [Helicobacter saguini]